MEDPKLKELVKYITTSIIFKKTILESEGLSSKLWEKYLSLSRKKIFIDKDDYLIRIGENLNGVYFIKKGKIKGNLLSRDGITKTFSFTCEGCLFGEQFLFHEQPGLFEAIAVEDSELYFFDKDTVYNLMKEDFEISLFIMKSLAIRSRMLVIQLEDLSFRNILQSVCRILYSLCCYEEKNGKIEGDIIIYLSHQDIANMLASHRVTITKNLAKLKEKGILDYKYEKIIIKDRQRLKKLAFE